MRTLPATGACARNPFPVCLMGIFFLGSTHAHASGFALLEQSAKRLGTAFAGTGAAADDATTIFFNPAGLAYLDAKQVAVVASGIEIASEFRNAGSQAAFGQPLGNSGGDAGGWNFVPAAYAALPLTDKLAAGIGVNAPFGLKLVYGDGWMGRFQALRSEIKTLNLNPTLAYRLNERVAFGLGIDHQRLEAEFTNAVNYSAAIAQGIQQLVANGTISAGAAPALIAANAGLEGHTRVRGDDTGWGFNFGMTFDVGPATRLSVAYRSAVDYKLQGTAGFTAPTVAQPVGASIVATASAPGGSLANGAISVDIELPDSAVLSLRQRMGEKAELFADVAWTGWSSIQELRIVRDSGATLSVTPESWDDTWRFALGASYALSPKVILRGGVAFDQTPVPDSTRTPRLPDSDRPWIAIGASWEATESVVLDFGYAHLFNDTVPLNQDAGSPSAYGLLAGSQHTSIDVVSTQLSYRFK